MIADVFAEGKVGALGSARSVYLALGEIASDKQSDTFTVATSYVAQRAGVTSKTVRRVIASLRKLGLVTTKARSANGLKLPTEYTLIRTSRQIGLIYPSLSKSREIVLPIKEESHEESNEGTTRNAQKVRQQLQQTARVSHSNRSHRDQIVIMPNGERFNTLTGEYDW